MRAAGAIWTPAALAGGFGHGLKLSVCGVERAALGALRELVMEIVSTRPPVGGLGISLGGGVLLGVERRTV